MAGRFSWPGHFRNVYLHSGDWRPRLVHEIMNHVDCALAIVVPRGESTGMCFLPHSRIVMLATLLLGASSLFGATASNSSSQPKKHTVHQTSHHSARRSKRKRGQQAIDNERARQIQQALVREHYMKSQPSGTWDASTQDAMRRYQADQGWQTKEVPDSRALIRLGLGPDKDRLLNPESAMTTEPQLPHSASSAHSGTSSNSAPAADTLPASAPAVSPVTPAPDLSPSR